MRNTSSAFRRQLENDRRNFIEYADITLKNGTVLNLSNKDIWTGGFMFDDSVSGDNDFQIGAAIINTFVLTLNNIYDEFSEYDFFDARISASIGLALEDGSIEPLQIGKFTVDEPKYNGSIIVLNCLDNMAKFDRPYNESSLNYPTTVGEIVRDACDICGVPLLTTVFDGSDQVIRGRPDDETVTFRQIIAWCAQRCCKFAKCDVYGRLTFGWYDISAYEQMGGLDGGWFDARAPYSSGDSADGGTFNPWNTGDSVNAGDFSLMSKYHYIYSTNGLQVCTDDVVITGVKVSSDADAEAAFYQYGTDGYVISVSENKLIAENELRAVAEFIGVRVVGLRFRPFSCSCLGDPSIEAGDICYISDRKGIVYKSLVTHSSYQIGSYQNVSCGAETPSRNSATRYSEETKAIVEARKNTEKQILKYDQTVQQMTQLISQGFGMYMTPVEQANGGVIWYLHDKPTIKESGYVCYHTSNGIMASTNGGTSWAIDKNGNALVKVLTAVGINFDWAHGGTLTLGGSGNGNGRLVIRNASGTQIGYIDNTGVHFNQGEFSGTLQSAVGVFKGKLEAATGTFGGTVTAGRVEGSEIEGSTISTSGDGENDYGKIVMAGGKLSFFYGANYFGSMQPDYDAILDENGMGSYSYYLDFDCDVQVRNLYQSSDERKKQITGWNDRYDMLLMKLEPIEFTWKTESDKGLHTGLGAQRTKKLLEKFDMEESGLVRGNDETSYSINYSDLHALEIASIQKNRKLFLKCVKMIKDLYKRTRMLEKKVRDIESALLKEME